jgi:serine/threonine-protein kinase
MQPNNLVHFPPAQKLGRYEITSVVAQGAMGTVYKAMDPLIERVVAIKTINIDLSQEELAGFEERFYREARAAGQLNHPNIITIYDVGKTDHIAYIAMEFLDGQSLREILDSGVVMPIERIVKITGQVAKGLAYAEKFSIVHRDIKPANIFITRNGLVKITDFGIAYSPSASRTVAGMVFGSPKYMSPEQVEGKPVDGRSDIFSLGVLLYEMLAGRPPFVGDNISTVMYRIVNEMPTPPSQINSRTPAGFDQIIAKALAKLPENRYQNAKEFANDLARYKELSEAPKEHPAGESKSSFFSKLIGGAHDQQISEKETGGGTIPDYTGAQKTQPNAAGNKRKVYYGLIVLLLAFAITVGLYKDKLYNPERPATVVKTEIPPVPIAPVNKEPDPVPVTTTPVAPVTPVNTEAPTPVKTPETVTAPDASRIIVTETPPTPVIKKPKKTVASTAHKTHTEEPKIQPGDVKSVRTEEPKTQPETSDPNAAILDFAIAPWGEIYIDGKKIGISPPLKTFKVGPGKHIVEIKNTDLPPYSATMDLEPQANKKIKHRFIILNDK